LFFTINKDKKGNALGSVREKDILAELTKLDKNLIKNQLIDFQPLRELGKKLVKIKIKNDLTAHLNIVID
jgi:ribosomal protein L9